MWYLNAFCVMLFACLHRIGSFLVNFFPNGLPIICEMSMVSTQETEFLIFFSLLSHIHPRSEVHFCCILVCRDTVGSPSSYIPIAFSYSHSLCLDKAREPEVVVVGARSTAQCPASMRPWAPFPDPALCFSCCICSGDSLISSKL